MFTTVLFPQAPDELGDRLAITGAGVQDAELRVFSPGLEKVRDGLRDEWGSEVGS